MAKQAAIERDGTIIEALSNAMFREMCIRDRASKGLIPGVTKASW